MDAGPDSNARKRTNNYIMKTAVSGGSGMMGVTGITSAFRS
jgi:hypothetical protein